MFDPRRILFALQAVCEGDFSAQLPGEWTGVPGKIAAAFNQIVAQNRVMAQELARIGRVVGREGKAGQRVKLLRARGAWSEMEGSINALLEDLLWPITQVTRSISAVARGDLQQTVQLEVQGRPLRGELLRLATIVKDMIRGLKVFTSEVTRVAREVGSLGERGGQAQVPGVAGTWKDLTDSFNLLAANLTTQVRNIAEVTTAVARGDLSRPVLFEGQVKAVIELASLGAFTASHVAFLEQLTSNLGVLLNSIEATMRTEALLKQSQELARELQTCNEQLEQKARRLAEHNVEVERKNQEIEQARRALEEKAAELALTSKYKSEFLANLSHELRTPLNSILILGQQLGENAEGNLTPRQVEFARAIHGAGKDLLNLISDILDLSKIESGTVTVEAEDVPFSALLSVLERTFRHEAESRQLSFKVDVDPRLTRLVTDQKRLQQVLRNLLSNAFKFTEQGEVRLRVSPATGGWSPDHPVLSAAPAVVAFEVSDTGIGIPLEKQKIIFEAFQQADASTSRRFGGTGLGLAISRELASLLDGEIQLRSSPREGSTFTLYLPLHHMGPTDRGEAPPRIAPPYAPMLLPERPVERVADDRQRIVPGDAVLLIVEDDPHYAQVLADLARDEGFKVLVAMTGAEALGLAREYNPTAVSLDVFLPDMLGWTVLGQLKQDSSTRHIPVQMVTLDEARDRGLARGAWAFLNKPADAESLALALARIKEYAAPHRKRLLVVEDNPAELLSITELLGHEDIDITSVSTGEAALAALRQETYHCVVLDLRLPDMSGFDVLERLRDEPSLAEVPVVVFTGKDLSPEEDARLHTLARSVVIKGVESPERLLDETALFLHRVVSDLPPGKQRMLERLYQSDEYLAGKSVLVVDDDVRNIFALSSVLERRGMSVLTATTGREAIETLDSRSDVAIVLMDIMMPEMDGYQTMQVLRANPKLARLPIIALTAKAMKGDREKCLQAGASDYLAKPVHTEQLLAVLRMWLHR